MTFSVLFVCTGNICRSPVAEKLFRARLPDGADVGVSSAGTNAVVGYGIDGPSALALSEVGGDPGGHRARQLDVAMISGADLVLGASAEHRRIVLRDEPAAMGRTFTLREFGRLGAGLATEPDMLPDAERLCARVRLIAAQRGNVRTVSAHADDIGDPFGASLTVARSCVGQISDAVGQALAALGLD